MSGAALLPEPQQAAREDDGQNDQRVGGVVEEERQAGREQQDEDERALELTEQEEQLAGSPPRLKDVGAVEIEPPPGVGARQAVLGRLQVPQDIGDSCAPEELERIAHAAAPPGGIAPCVTVSV